MKKGHNMDFKSGVIINMCIWGVTFLLIPSLALCAPKTSTKVKDDVSESGQTEKLEEAGVNYTGPQSNVAIMTFDNKTPSKAIGIGEAATDILRTIVKKAGLEPISLTEDEIREQERMIALQQTGAVKTGKKDASEGFESIDFSVSGAVTSYSEVEEGSEFIIGQSKTQVARVQVDYALVDIATGKSLVAESGMGEYRKKTGKILGVGSKYTEDTGMREGAVRDGLTKAMTKMTEKLKALPFQSAVLLVDGDSII